MGIFKDLTGQRFERLVVVDTAFKKRQWFWNCVCDCGNKVIVAGCNLRSGNTNSCGCYRDERRIESHRIHGLSKTYIEHVYRGMLSRCLNEKDEFYKDYGGRGVTVCSRWSGTKGLQNFAEDMGERPDGYQIDRINNDGPYSPENCRWASLKTNARNKRNTVFITFNNKTLSLPEWAEELGMHYKALYSRVQRWGIERAFFEPVYTHQQRLHNRKVNK